VRYIVGFFRFWYEFIVGDDWSVAAGVVAALTLTSLLTRRGVDAWWLLPLAVVLVLFASVWRACRRETP
jgi:hypothetical protein